MNKLLLFTTTSILICLFACKSEKKAPTNPTPEAKLLLKGDALSAEVLTKSNNNFALDIFKNLAEKQADENLFFSPLSISAALAMTYAGAAGTTEAEMGKTLHWKDNTENMHQSFSDLTGKLKKSDKEFTINIANRLYTAEGLKLFQQFSDINADKYGASVQSIDFSKMEEAANTINGWVSEQTQKMIPELLKPAVLKDAKLVLVNAVYFYGGWANKFEEESTKKDTFWQKDGNPIVTDFMSDYWDADDEESKHPYAYTETNKYQVLSLPYAEGKGNMVIFLPRADSSAVKLQEVILKLTLEELNSSIQSLSSINGILDLKLPKWKQRSSFNLVDVFKALGMQVPFSDDADFSRITSDMALKIGAIIHEAVVEVSEKGTKAAASTAVITKEAMATDEVPKVIEFFANRPFFYLIRDSATGSILFMGVYRMP